MPGRFQPGDRVRYESQYNEHGERADETLYGTVVRTDSGGVEVQFDGYDGTDGIEDDSLLARNLSDEARFLQRLAEPELPPGASDAERAAAGVEHVANELGGHWAEAYQEILRSATSAPAS